LGRVSSLHKYKLVILFSQIPQTHRIINHKSPDIQRCCNFIVALFISSPIALIQFTTWHDFYLAISTPVAGYVIRRLMKC